MITGRWRALGTVVLSGSLAVLQSCGSDGDGPDGGGTSTGSASGSGASSSGTGATSSSGDGGGIGAGVGGSLLGQGGEGGEPGDGECGDGIDNDGDGLVDYALDPGCFGPWDGSEASGTRAEESGFTTFEFGDDSVVVYVSADGDDAENGATPETAVRTLARGSELVRDGEHDFMLLRRGDTWRDETLGRFKSGRDAEHPIVIGSYGESLDLPRLELSDHFINHNGEERNFVALLDLHFINYRMEPTDPAFDGATGGNLRYVGGGSNLLIEGCHFEYVEVIIQGAYTGVEVRANVLEKAYHADTCEAGNPAGSDAYLPSGMFVKAVDGLLLEGNLFDHNGWNEDVPSACATIYNHNAYLNGDNIVIVDNVFARASSIHIKLKTDTPGDVTGTRISGNYFVEGEVGVSIGDSRNSDDRFIDSEIVDNVFSDIGRSQPTTRTLAWAVEIIDADGILVQGNHFLNQFAPELENSFALSISDGAARNLDVLGNLFYRIKNRALIARVSGEHEAITIADNTFVDPDQGSRVVVQEGPFSAYTYANNRYYSSASPNGWFNTDEGNVGVDDWSSASGETGAEELSEVPNFADPDRTIETYAQSLELGNSLQGFLSQARLQTRLRYYYELSAPAINGYIRAGFEE